jgi:hypothetical protein
VALQNENRDKTGKKQRSVQHYHFLTMPVYHDCHSPDWMISAIAVFVQFRQGDVPS